MFDAAGKLVYFGPYSDSARCGVAGGLVERVLDRMLADRRRARSRSTAAAASAAEKLTSNERMTHMAPTNTYLSQIRQGGDRLLLCVVGALLLLSFALAPWYGTWTEALAIGLPTMGVVAWLVNSQPGALVTRCAIAAALMIFTALNIHQAHGMIEVHFGFFVLLAFLLFYRDWVPLVVAAGVAAIHHFSFDFAQRMGAPVWVFAANTGFSIVLIHAAYVIFETALLVFMAVRLKGEIEAVGCEPRELARVSQELARGNVAVKVPTEGATAGSLALAMAAMREELQSAVQGAGEVLQAVAAGDLSRRVTVKASGEFDRLNNHVNKTVNFLASFSGNQHQLVQRANAGDFGGRCETAGLAGYQLEMANGLNQLVTSVESFVDDFGAVQSALARGDLTKPNRAYLHGAPGRAAPGHQPDRRAVDEDRQPDTQLRR